jgi:N-acyl homoserine lactone hydrolase
MYKQALSMVLALVVSLSILTIAQARPISSDLELWRLDCGAFQAPLNNFSDLLSKSNDIGAYVDSCYLIRHGKDLLLWDAGLPTSLLGKVPEKTASIKLRLTTTISAQLKQIGYQPSDVTLLGLSHNHLDHTGQASEFPGARLLMDKKDFDALRETPPPFFTDPATLLPWISADGNKNLIDGDFDVFGDGQVIMVALPGHTAGNHGLLVRLNRTGPILISGDALHTEAEMTSGAVPPSNSSRADSLASIHRIKGIIRKTNATLIVEHDPRSVHRLPSFPKAAN